MSPLINTLLCTFVKFCGDQTRSRLAGTVCQVTSYSPTVRELIPGEVVKTKHGQQQSLRVIINSSVEPTPSNCVIKTKQNESTKLAEPKPPPAFGRRKRS